MAKSIHISNKYTVSYLGLYIPYDSRTVAQSKFWKLTFHKLVQRHVLGVLIVITMTLLQIYCRM